MGTGCKWTWRVVIGWVPDEGNGTACPAEEHCDPPPNPGTVDGQVEYTGCLAERPAPVRRAGKGKR